MHNFIIAVILIVFIVIFTTVNSFYICSVCDDIEALLNEGKIEEAVELWNSKKYYISFFVRDAEMDVVSTEADNLLRHYSLEDGEAESAKMSFSDAVNEIKLSEKLSFESIFVLTRRLKTVIIKTGGRALSVIPQL